MVPEIVMLLAAGQWSFARVCWREMRDILAEQDEQLMIETGDNPLAKTSTAPVVSISGDATPSAENDVEEIQMIEMSRPKMQRSETFEQRQQRTDDERWTLRHGKDPSSMDLEHLLKKASLFCEYGWLPAQGTR